MGKSSDDYSLEKAAKFAGKPPIFIAICNTTVDCNYCGSKDRIKGQVALQEKDKNTDRERWLTGAACFKCLNRAFMPENVKLAGFG